MAGLESCYAAINTLFPHMPAQQLVNLLSGNARNIFGLPAHNIAEGASANLTLFSREDNREFTKENIKGICANNAFIGKSLNGKVIGVINKDQLYLN
jgi:dihydroorotase